MFKIKAKFIGKNSLGFIKGNIYEFVLLSMPHIEKGYIEIKTTCKKRCDYNSWELFIPNWEILHSENMTGDHDVEAHNSKVNAGLKQAVRNTKLNKVLS